ncbi:helix-turn-helix domain-containing protein [Paenibacillus sp. HJGM_3]|uniref:helix-turn-helix domain-containing protein n=1 Tax=Paenibacillus sp. HJGM_3 TaxID=3379816 RepID=UPI0038590380
MEKNQIAQRVRAFRKLKGLTQDELAKRLGVSIAILGAIERGSRKAEPRMLARIAETLNIDPVELNPVLEKGEDQ